MPQIYQDLLYFLQKLLFKKSRGMYIYIYDEEDVPEEVYMREALRKEILDMIMVKEIFQIRI